MMNDGGITVLNQSTPARKGFTLKQGPPTIPDKYFEDILIVWDTCRTFAGIVHDILNRKDEGINSELRQVGVNVGQMGHFTRFMKDYFLQLSLNDFYECFKQIEANQFYVDILLFLSSFYLKQIIEDVEQESQSFRIYNKGSLWQLLNFLWLRDQDAYFEVITERVFELPIDIQSFGILHFDEEGNSDEQFNVRLNIVKDLCEGLMELKRTSTLLQFRTESILFSNRLRQTYQRDIRETRSRLVQINDELRGKEEQSSGLKKQIEENNLSRQDQSKLHRQIEHLQKEIYKLRSQSNKEKAALDECQESYDELEKTMKLNQLPQLYHNSSMHLGNDAQGSLYYFFMHDPHRIYFQKENSQWGYINKVEHVEKISKSLNPQKGTLKANLQQLLQSKLFTAETHQQRAEPIFIEYLLVDSWKKLVQSMLQTELTLSTYLATHQGRWIGPEDRKQFRSTLNELFRGENLKLLVRQLEFFLERTIMQERLEIKSDNDMQEEEMELELQEPQLTQMNKRRIVEDESDSVTAEGGQLEVLEHMDPSKVKVKKLPLKLFGNIQDNLRHCCFDLVRYEGVQLSDTQLVVYILERVICDYVNRKMEKEQEQRVMQEEPVVTKLPEPQLMEIPYSKNLRIRPKQKPMYSETDNHWEDSCKVCGQTGKVICCDTCPSVFHLKCLGLKQIPQGKWSCLKCLSRMEAQIKTRAAVKKFQS